MKFALTAWTALVVFTGCTGDAAPTDPVVDDTMDGTSAPFDPTGLLSIDLENPDDYGNADLPAYWAAQPTNEPATNRVTDEGATLGRVLFYDVKLSLNETTSCASCHTAATGFTDPERFSEGFEGGRTPAHSMRLANAAYYRGQDMFWDRRAESVEDQSLMPVMDGVEMGFDAEAGGLDALIARLAATDYYPVLFDWAFGTEEITEARMRSALAQFVRSMVAAESEFDQALEASGYTGGPIPLNLVGLDGQESRGLRLFLDPPDRGGAGCAGCHQPPTFSLDANSRSNGLDQGETTVFKSPSLVNVAVEGSYMHDGRFETLREVVEHYSTGVQPGPALDRRLTGPNGRPIRLNLSDADIDAIVAFLRTLTDESFLSDERFSNPFIGG